MSPIELADQCWGFDSVCRFPTNVLVAIACPFDLVLKFSTENAAVQDFFYDIMFLSVYNSRRCRWFGTSAGNGVGNGRREFDGVEYRVYTRHGARQSETVSQMANLAFDNKWSEILVR